MLILSDYLLTARRPHHSPPFLLVSALPIVQCHPSSSGALLTTQRPPDRSAPSSSFDALLTTQRSPARSVLVRSFDALLITKRPPVRSAPFSLPSAFRIIRCSNDCSSSSSFGTLLLMRRPFHLSALYWLFGGPTPRRLFGAPIIRHLSSHPAPF